MRIKSANGMENKIAAPPRRQAAGGWPPDGDWQIHARAFFEKFMEYEGKLDPALPDLYADRARIIIYRSPSPTFISRQEFTGRQWKERLRDAVLAKPAEPDRNVYSDMVYMRLGSRVRIKADRYCVDGDYTDTGYYLILEPHGEGYRIIEEYCERP